MSVFLIPDALAGDRIDAVAARVSGYSRSRIETLIDEGKVSLDGTTITKGSHRVHGGELLELDDSAPVGIQVTPQDRKSVV